MYQFCTLNLWSSHLLQILCVAFELFVLKVLATNTWHTSFKTLKFWVHWKWEVRSKPLKRLSSVPNEICGNVLTHKPVLDFLLLWCVVIYDDSEWGQWNLHNLGASVTVPNKIFLEFKLSFHYKTSVALFVEENNIRADLISIYSPWGCRDQTLK